ncbi:MAG: hypothetical protein AAF587_08835 [Bacteroidota bacterium]
MQNELIYAQREFINDQGEKVKDLKPIGEIHQDELYLYMFPNLDLRIEPNEEDQSFAKVLVLDSFIKGDEEVTKRYLVGFTKQTQYQKYLNLNMFRDGVYIIKDVPNQEQEDIIN